MKQLHEITCQNPKCGKKKMVKLDRARTCCNRCGSALWRIEHPRAVSPNTYTYNAARGICGRDSMRRDTPKRWTAYMTKNPILHECVGKINIGMF